jgi:peptidoglycan/LPS O-acetylase OafA/YrhL
VPPAKPTAAVERLQILDLLRFLAAVGVVFYHMTYRPAFLGGDPDSHFPTVQAISRFGFLGVELFFIISGFVILWSASGRTASMFVASRISRLLPSLWTGIALTTIVLTLLDPNDAIHDVKTLAANMSMIAGYVGLPFVDGVYWTLAVEIKFYVLVFLLIAFGQLPNIGFWLVAWLLGLAVSYTPYGVGWLKSLVIFPYGSYFVGGCFLFLIWRDGLSPFRLVGVLASLALSMLCLRIVTSGFVHQPEPIVNVISAVVVVVFFVVLFLTALRRIELPDSSLWIRIGELTYPLYLLHNRIGRTIGEWARPIAGIEGALAAAIVVPFLLAALVARTVERRACPRLRQTLLRLAARFGLKT